MAESAETRIARFFFNFFPAVRRTSMRIIYIAKDWRHVKIKLPFNWKTKNYHRTMFGGSMFAATDPVYLVMLTKILGPEYIVWDKAACIRYKKPAKTTLYADFKLNQLETNKILEILSQQEKVDRLYQIDLIDKQATVYATVEKTLHIRKRNK